MVRCRQGPILMWWLLAAITTGDAGSASVSASGPITSITLDAHGPHDPEAVLEALGLAVGHQIDRQRLREGVHALYAGGDVESLRVEAVPAAEGIEVVVHLALRSRISRLEVEAPSRRWQQRVVRWLELRPGEPVSTALVEARRQRVLRRLNQKGFSEATVESFLDYHRPTNTVEVTVAVSLGTPEELGAVVLEGVPDPEVAAVALPSIKPGTRLSAHLLDRLRERVEARLRRDSFWEAQVTGVRRQHDQGGVTLVLDVDSGPRYEVEIDAPAELVDEVRDALPDPEVEDLHPAQTGATAEQIRENLQRAGWLLAEVHVELVMSGSTGLLKLTARPGSRRQVVSIDFSGATNIEEKVLARTVEVRPHRSLRRRPVSDAGLERDRAALEDLYRRQGFAEAKVAPAVLLPVGDDGVAIRFDIEEGPRLVVQDLRLEGFPAEAMAAIESGPLAIAERDPWDPRNLEPTCRRLQALLADVGYPDSSVAGSDEEVSPGAVRVTLVASPGEYVTIGRVVIAGLETTRPGVVQAVLDKVGIRQGRPLAQHALLAAQRKLYELGLFRRVELLPIPGQERRSTRGLVVRCQEGAHRSYLFGIGWDTVDRTRLTLGWSHLNLFGAAHGVSAELRLSEREERYQVSLWEPELPWLETPGYLTLYRTTEEYATYSQDRRGLWLEIGDRRRQPLRTWLRYEYQVVQPDAPPEVLSELEREDQQIELSSLTPSIQWDTRNDPLTPSKGVLASASIEYAFPAFRADTELVKLQGAASMYRPLSRGVAAFGLRIGAIEPLGPDTGEAANLQVPLNVRFFAGGRATHRAFATDRLGIPGQTRDESGNPLGGNALVLLNAEYQRTLAGPLSGVLFVDGGNVWAEPSRVRWRDLRWGYGGGLRLDTPAGPLRLEYGRKLDRLEPESSGELYLSFGVAF
jgi:outer membrane protein insertion porin family